MAWKEEFAHDSARCPDCGKVGMFVSTMPDFFMDLVTFECLCKVCGAGWVETYRLDARDGYHGEHVKFE